MSIAEKTLLLKQDFDEVHAKGYEDGKNSVVDIARYATQIRLKSLNMFGKPKAEINLDSAEQLSYTFQISAQENSNITVEELTINCPNLVTSFSYFMTCTNWNSYDRTLKRLVLNANTSKSNNFVYAFAGLYVLERIEGLPLDFSMATNGLNTCFNNDENLKSFRVVANSIKVNFSVAHSRNLDTDTIQSIIDGLADLTGGTAQTLTLHSTVGAKLTDEQKATITAKNWTLVY